MPRNEFANHNILEGLTDLEIRDMLRAGKCTVNDVRRHRGLPPAREEPAVVTSDPSLEVVPAEDDPHMWPKGTSLADLRKSPGATTTQAHIAERYSNEDAHLE